MNASATLHHGHDGIIGIGVALFAILEIEKRTQRAVAGILGAQGTF